MRMRNMLVGLVVAVLLSSAAFSFAGCAGGQPTCTTGDRSEVTRYGNGYRFDSNGWTYVHIEGQPYDRGFQHGYLVAPELKEILRSLKYLTYWNTGMEWEFFVAAAENLFLSYIDQEFLDEMKGIADGAQAAGTNMSWQEVLAWNDYEELVDYWWPSQPEGEFASVDYDHCSAFIATGTATEDGKIVMAHNSWDDFAVGQFFSLILDIQPASGHRMFMQSAPGFIDSMTDYFVTDAGLMGTETTIGGFGKYNPNEVPEFVRVRKAMQYANTLDEFVEIMQKQNDGGYANSWLLGDLNSGEIMRFELGLKYTKIERTKDGYFVGFNAATDPQIRNLECSNTGYADIRRPTGARQVRLTELMEKYYGKIDLDIARKVISDHYDVYLKKDNPCSRTIDGHYELDPFQYYALRLPFQPMGAVDGKVIDSDLARELSFCARFGNSSGMSFDAEKFLTEHIQYSYLGGYLKDRPSQPWTIFKAGDGA